jgi:hypothetical protein
MTIGLVNMLLLGREPDPVIRGAMIFSPILSDVF